MSKENPKYYFMPANFEECDFEDLFLKYSDSKVVRWQKNNHTIEEGDVIFIYYCNMPDKVSRIMLRGVVENPSAENNSVIEMKVEGLDYSTDIKNDNKMKFATSNLRNTYGITCFRNCFQLNKKENETETENCKKQGNLIRELNKFQYTSLEDIKNRYFTTNCYFKDESNSSGNEYSNHPTFKKNNGLSYIECHHMIHRSIASKYKDVFDKDGYDPLIYNDLNEVNLCSNCHNKIHYANDGDRKQMIDLILEDKNRMIKFQEIFDRIKTSKYYKKGEYSSLEEFIYSLYKIPLDKNNKRGD